MNQDLTQGNITKGLFKFALPLMAGNILQQLYNVADTFIVGKYLGEQALAAVGSSYTLMIFLTSVLLGLCMGSSAFLSICYGRRDMKSFKDGSFLSFVLIGALTLAMNILIFLLLDGIIIFMRVPEEITGLMKEYLKVIFCGLAATFLYNYFASCLRAVGNSLAPLLFLGCSTILNIVLDLLFVLVWRRGVSGAAEATVISQYIAGAGIMVYYIFRCQELRVGRNNLRFDGEILKQIASLSVLTCVQQSIMNFGILLVQGLVNSFGTVVMAAFAAAVKIDTLAYSPVQDFGNAFSTFVAQNHGAAKEKRIAEGMKKAVLSVAVFCAAVSLIVCLLAEKLMGFFVKVSAAQVISVGAQYLRIEGAFYFFIGLLFLFYGYYRAVEKPGMSVLLTVISLGTRVVLAYLLSAVPAIGVRGIWVSIPIGWILADTAGSVYLKIKKRGTGQVP